MDRDVSLQYAHWPQVLATDATFQPLVAAVRTSADGGTNSKRQFFSVSDRTFVHFQASIAFVCVWNALEGSLV